MRNSKFSEMQIVEILKGAESGVPVAYLLRKYGVSKATFFKRRSKYGAIPSDWTRYMCRGDAKVGADSHQYLKRNERQCMSDRECEDCLSRTLH